METIFVSICSYRDKICKKTVENLFENAEYPDRIFVGICEQNKKGMKEEECIKDNERQQEQIRIIKMDHEDAKGPTYARFLCSLLYKGEDFFLQIDSHTLFVKHWDTLCISMLKDIERKDGVKKVVLSYYPDMYENYEEFPDNEYVTRITQCEMNNHGIIMFKGANYIKTEKNEHASKNYFIGANFVFARGAFLKDVPFDPFLPYLFMGEEILLSVRSYTSGYDIYSPNKNLVYHLYTRKHDPKYWDDLDINQQDANTKVRILLGFETDPSKIRSILIQSSLDVFGLGTERTLKQYYQDSGLDTKFGPDIIIEKYCSDKHTFEQQLTGLYTSLIILSILLILAVILRIAKLK